MRWSPFKKARNDSFQTVKNQPNIQIYAIYFISLAGYTHIQNKSRLISLLEREITTLDAACVVGHYRSHEHYRYGE